MSWISKGFSKGEDFAFDQAFAQRLIAEGDITCDVLMVSESTADGMHQEIFIWSNNTRLIPRLFRSYKESEGPKSQRPTLLAGKVSVYEQVFPKS